ncbi:hypothetical protein BD779DRAFT_1495567 [Infundibulicybe gibba]|nr:hypothetical protein BD779DRAFT_1495567 [Infundibulicybe gibba]
MFPDLPEDILASVCAYISPEDLLALKQTCRVLHAFASMDYIWHQLKIDIPLDIPSDGDIHSLSGVHCQRLVIDALRLDHNWRKPVSKIKGLVRIENGGIISQTQLLGHKWLVTLSRAPSNTHLSFWSIGERNYRAASMEMLSASKFSAAFQNEGSRVILAVIVRGDLRSECLNIYSVPLKDSDEVSPSNTLTPQLYLTMSRLRTECTFSEVQVCQHIVAVALAQFGPMGGFPSYRLLFVNTLTKLKLLVDPALPLRKSPGVGHLRFKLYPKHVIFAVILDHGNPLVLLHELPAKLLDKETREMDDTPQFEVLGPPISKYEIDEVPSDLAAEAAFTPSRVSAIMFHSFSRHAGSAYVVNFIQGKSPNKPPDALQVHRLMKATFSSTGASPMVGELLPRHFPLPFEPQACQSLSFDEATGRVCIGLHTGEIYLLDLWVTLHFLR